MAHHHPRISPAAGGVSDYTAQLAPALEQAGQPVRVWCREFSGFTKEGMAHVARELDRSPPPRRLLLQWVPHGFGCHSMNVRFCRWIANRPEPLEIMFTNQDWVSGKAACGTMPWQRYTVS